MWSHCFRIRKHCRVHSRVNFRPCDRLTPGFPKFIEVTLDLLPDLIVSCSILDAFSDDFLDLFVCRMSDPEDLVPVSYTHLRAHETDSYLVCRLLLEKKKT